MSRLTKKEIRAGLKKLGIQSSSELNTYCNDYKKYYAVSGDIVRSSDGPECMTISSADNTSISRRLARYCISLVLIVVSFFPLSRSYTLRLIKR